MEGEATELSLRVTGRGMVAALGHDVHTNAAAVRAGLSGGAELAHFRIRSSVDGRIEPIVGHVVPDFTDGFEGFARLLRIAQGALVDLARATKPAGWGTDRAGFYLSLPDPLRPTTGIMMIADDGERRSAEARAEEARAEAAESPLELGQRLLRAAARAACWPADPDVRFVSTAGHTGVADAVRVAAADLDAGRVDLAVVGGVDSMVDEDTLAWLQRTGRLKSTGQPDGLPPGEAGAFFVLEPDAGTAPPRAGRALATVRRCATSAEPAPHLEAKVPLGAGLAEAVLEAHAGRPGDGGRWWVVGDHNGETYRAMDWGHALSRLRGHDAFFADPVSWFPAEALGDTGAASGAVALCVALSAWERRYAPADAAAVLCAADGPARAALVLAPARVPEVSR